MDTFEITIQRRDGAGWPVIVEQSSPGSLTPERSEGLLTLDEAGLRALELSPEAYGRALGEALFAGAVYDAFRRALSRSEERLRVLLFIEDAALRALRWERLCAPIDDRWQILALSQRAPFSRYLPSLTDRRFPQIGRQDLRALIVAASPANMARFRLEPFDVAEAVGGVQRALDGLPAHLLSDLPGSAGPPSLDAICAQISAEPFTLLHIVCHGRVMPDGQSVMFLARDDDPAEVDPVTATRLIERLSGLQGARGLPRFTFLSTCESASPGADAALGGLAQRLVRELGMPAVVAMTDKVQIATANALAAAFYARLRDHGEVDRALVEASSGLAERGTILVPALFSRLGGQPLFSDSLDRPLGPDDIAAGLGLLGPLLGERAPVLVGELDAAAATLRRTLGADPGGLTRAARQERDAAMAEVESICAEASELSFRALALGQPPPAYDARCPFPGLRSFQADARDFFFGREPLVQRLIGRLAEHPFLAVLGASGSGKSSLVFAGLLPALQARDPQLRPISLTPGERPPQALAAALAAADTPRRILVVDQFEEAFTLCQDQAQRADFFAALLALADSLPVVITMRADFLGEVAPYTALRDRVQHHQELVAPMTPEELRRAMELQAAAVGLRFEADLGGQILDDVRGEPGAMPLLQHALQELWQRRRGRWLRAAEYRAVGGIQQAIAHSADQIYDSCAPADRERLRAIFVRLTRLDREALAGEERRDTRQRVTLADLTPAGADPAPLRELLRRLADARLVVTGARADEETVEVAHEALIRSWPRLRAWLEEDRAGLLLRDSIRQAAQEWQGEDRDPALLFRGSRLDESLALSLQPRFAPNELERSFLDASQDLREQEAAEKEAARQRELEQARALAAEQQRRAEEQAAAAAQLRRRAVFLAGVAVVALGAMVAAVLFGARAQQSERAAALAAAEANQRALIANAQAAAGFGRPDLALALGLSAAANESALPEANNLLATLAENTARRRLDTGAPGQVWSLSFSPRGDELFVATGQAIQVWGPDGGAQSRSYGMDDIGNWPAEMAISAGSGFKRAALSPDGSLLVAASDFSLLSWGAAGGRTYGEELGAIYPEYVAFLPDSRTVALGAYYGGPVLFDLYERTLARTLAAPSDEALMTAFAISPDGASLAAAYDSPPLIAVWDLGSASPAPRLTIGGHTGTINALAFSPDGARLASASNDTTARIWQVADGAELLALAHESGVSAVAFGPDGLRVLTGTLGGVAQLWGDTGAPLRRFAGHANDSGLTSLAFSPDGARVATAGWDNSVRIWDVDGYKAASGGWLGRGPPMLARFSPGGDALVGLAGGLGRITPGAPPVSALQEVDGQVLDLSPDEQRAAIFRPGSEEQMNPETGAIPGQIGVWDLAGGGVSMLDSEWPIVMAAFTPDGERLLTLRQDGLAQIRDGHTAAVLREFAAEVGSVFALRPDGRQFAVASSRIEMLLGGDVQIIVSLTLWDVEGGAQARELPAQTALIEAMAYSPDGSLLAIGYGDSSIGLWQLETGELRRTLTGFKGAAQAIAFSPDGSLLISSSSDQVARLWDVATGEELRSFAGQPAQITRVAISADNTLLLTSAADGAAILWRNDTGQVLVDWVRANRHVAELSCAERERYKVAPACAAEPTPTP